VVCEGSDQDTKVAEETGETMTDKTPGDLMVEAVEQLETAVYLLEQVVDGGYVDSNEFFKSNVQRFIDRMRKETPE